MRIRRPAHPAGDRVPGHSDRHQDDAGNLLPAVMAHNNLYRIQAKKPVPPERTVEN